MSRKKRKNSFTKNLQEGQFEKTVIEELLIEEEGTDEQVNLLLPKQEVELTFDQLRVEDLEKAERVNLPEKIKGIERITQTANREPKEMITKFDKRVFDAGFMQMHTSEITYKLLRDELIRIGAITDLVAEVNAGKEASIYIAHLNGAPLIVKAFRHQITCHNRAKGNPQLRAAAIAKAEYYRLFKAFNVGMRVPTPAMQINNTILMSFIGADWIPAPQMKDVVLENPEEVLDEIIEQMQLMYRKAKLIHGDLSEFNILIHENKPVFIDFPQAIDMSILQNRYPKILKKNLRVLQKDLVTICNHFEKEYQLTFDFNEVFKFIAGKDAREEEKIDYSLEEIEEMAGIHRTL